MYRYGQFCPVAHALEILGDRWTLLIIREMIVGTTKFNDLERGLPRLSRALLSKRLQQLQKTGVIEKRYIRAGRKSTEYRLTEAGRSLEGVMESLLLWGNQWALTEPTAQELDADLLMWWLRKRVNLAALPERRVVIQYDFYGAQTLKYWMLLTRQDVTLCLTDPGFDIELLVTADPASFFQVCQGPLSYPQALATSRMRVDGTPALARALPVWFGWMASPASKSNPPKSLARAHCARAFA